MGFTLLDPSRFVVNPRFILRHSVTSLGSGLTSMGSDTEANPPRLCEQVVVAQIAVGTGDDCRAGHVAYWHGDFRVCEAALARLRDEVGAQPVPPCAQCDCSEVIQL
jgi:hypothetical protein